MWRLLISTRSSQHLGRRGKISRKPSLSVQFSSASLPPNPDGNPAGPSSTVEPLGPILPAVSASATPLPPPTETFRRRRSGARKTRTTYTVSIDGMAQRIAPNPLLGPSDYFPDLSPYLLRHEDNGRSFNDESEASYPYPLDQAQKDEMTDLIVGFIRAQRKPYNDQVGVPRILTLGYAEAMGEVLLERTVQALGKQVQADVLTFHARDFGTMLDGLARLWYGRPYFTAHPKTNPPPPSNELEEFLEAEDELELAAVGNSSDTLSTKQAESDRWLSQFLARQSVFKPKPANNNGSAAIEARIKEQVNIFSILNHLCSCMDELRAGTPVRFIHLSGFGQSLTNPVYKAHILRFAREQEQAQRRDPSRPMTVLFISDPAPKNPEEPSSNAQHVEGQMPLNLTNFLALKGRLEKQSEIPNTPDHDSNWLVDRNAFGSLKLFIVPTSNPEARARHQARLEQDHLERVWNFNVKRVAEVLSQLGIGTDPGLANVKLEELCKVPLLLSEAMFIGYLAYSNCSDGKVVNTDGLRQAVKRYVATRNLQKLHFTQHHPSHTLGNLQAASGQRLDPKALTKYEKRFLPCIVTPEMVKTKFDDIGALDGVKRSLHELISLPMERPELFKSGILKENISGILLFGPPGTGKTMLAKAVAAQSRSNFIAVNSSSIYDMYVGEGEKNVKALFKLARKLSPCIIFIDEVDALLDSRTNTLSKSSRVEVLNEFMSEWDGLLSQSALQPSRVMVMAATNRPFALDDAVLRRLPRRILVDLPDPIARHQILQILLRQDQLGKDIDLAQISSDLMTRSYSGSDLKNVCIAAAMNALRERLAKNLSEPVPIGMRHFKQALQEVPASISDTMDTILQLRKWDQEFGEGKRLNRLTHTFGFRSH